MTVEYGIVVSVICFGLLIIALFGGGVPFVISYSMFFQYVFLNGGFLVPVNVFLLMMTVTLFQVERPAGLLPYRRPT